MPDLYNLTGLKASTTLVDLIIVANDATDQLLMGAFLIGIYIVMLMGMLKYGFKNSVIVSSFICFFLSAFLGAADLLDFKFVIGFATITAGLVAFSILKRTS